MAFNKSHLNKTHPVVITPSFPASSQSQSSFMEIANQLNLAIAIWDLSRMQVKFSSCLAQWYGFDPAEFQGQYETFLTYVHSCDRHQIQSVLQAAAKTGRPFEVDYRIMNDTGSIIWLSSQGRVFQTRSELIEVLQNVTPRYQVRQALVESNAQWSALLEKSNELLFQLDEQASVFWVSPSSSRILGYPPEALIGERLFDLVPEADFHKLQQALTALRSRQLPQTFQHALCQHSGEYLPVQSTLRLGQEVGSFAVLSCREIRARLDVQSALECTDAAYTAIVDATSQLVFRFLPDGTLTFANRAFWDCVGLDPGEGIGLNVYDFLVQGDREQFKHSCAALSVNKPTVIGQCTLQSIDGIQQQTHRIQALFNREDELLEYQVVTI